MAMRLVTSLPDEVVQTQLARVIASRQFCNAPRLSRFLTYVVEQCLAGRSDRLKGYTIGLEVFDKDADFDPQTDTIVRVQARALRQKLDQYYAQDGVDDPVYISIAKGGYEPTFFVSWEGEKPTDSVVAANSRRTNKPSIAVLPFEDFSQETHHGFLSNGLTEGTISNLARFKDLSVLSRSTTQKAKSDRMGVEEIHNRFDVDFVLESSFRVQENRVETNIKLIDAAHDEVILTDSISGQLDPSDIYKMQDEMSLQIAARIALEYGPIGRYARQDDNTESAAKWEAYGWISRYYELGIALDETARAEIKAGLKKVIENDLTSSDAHAAVALIKIEEYRAMTEHVADSAVLDRALDHALLAVKYDSQSAMAQQSLAIAYFHRRQFVDFRASVERALILNPGHSDMLAMFGICYVALAEWDKAIPMLDRAAALNPLQPGWYRIPKAIFLAMTKDAKAAIAEMEKSPMPRFYAFHFMLLWFHVEAGDMPSALLEKERLLAVAPNAEKLIRRHFDTWCLNDEIAERIICAFRKVGLNVVD